MIASTPISTPSASAERQPDDAERDGVIGRQDQADQRLPVKEADQRIADQPRLPAHGFERRPRQVRIDHRDHLFPVAQQEEGDDRRHDDQREDIEDREAAGDQALQQQRRARSAPRPSWRRACRATAPTSSAGRCCCNSSTRFVELVLQQADEGRGCSRSAERPGPGSAAPGSPGSATGRAGTGSGPANSPACGALPIAPGGRRPAPAHRRARNRRRTASGCSARGRERQVTSRKRPIQNSGSNDPRRSRRLFRTGDYAAPAQRDRTNRTTPS